MIVYIKDILIYIYVYFLVSEVNDERWTKMREKKILDFTILHNFRWKCLLNANIENFFYRKISFVHFEWWFHEKHDKIEVNHIIWCLVKILYENHFKMNVEWKWKKGNGQHKWHHHDILSGSFFHHFSYRNLIVGYIISSSIQFNFIKFKF